MKGKTRDEQYLLTLHKLALSVGDLFAEIDRYHVGKALGQNNKSVDNIVRMLSQTNFVKKGEDTAIHLTPNGLELIEQLL
jgi:Mn-dependent DtxR family transcriptional regulator